MATPKGQSNFSTGLANYFLKLRIGVVDVPVDSVALIVIRNWVFDLIGRIEITLQDNGTFFELYPIEDSTEILVEIGKSTESDHITATFLVDNSSVDILAGGASNVVTITGYLKNSNLFNPVKTRVFKNQSSTSVLSQLVGEVGWKVDKRINSSDNMNFLQINQNNFDMMKHLLERSYIPNDLLLAYTTLENQFVITSLKTAAGSEEVKILRFDLTKAAADILTEKEDQRTLWTNGFRFNNISGYLNRTAGNGIAGTYYDLKEKKDVSSAIDYHPMATFKSNQSNLGSFVDSVNYGTLTKNMHPNYFKGKLQNRQLLGSQFGGSITAKINPLAIKEANLSDIVYFVCPSINKFQSNEIVSGAYMICGQTMYASKGAPLQYEISLLRNGRNKSAIV